MMSPASIPGSTTPGSDAAQSILTLPLNSTGDDEKWLQVEISRFNVSIKRRCFPREASKALREALDEVLSLALSLHKSSSLAFNAFALFVLFPRLLLRPLPDVCLSSFAASTLSRRFSLLKEGYIAT
jgi:hypothetical protein